MADEFGEILCSFKKNASEVVGAGFSSFKGKDYFYIRVFTPSVDDPEALVPTAKGLSLNVEMLDEVIDGINQLADVMSNDKVVKKIKKGNNSECWIGVKQLGDNTFVYIQVYQVINGNMQHTKKAIFVALNKYDDLKKMLLDLKGATLKIGGTTKEIA